MFLLVLFSLSRSGGFNCLGLVLGRNAAPFKLKVTKSGSMRGVLTSDPSTITSNNLKSSTKFLLYLSTLSFISFLI